MAEGTKANYKLGELHFQLVLQNPGWIGTEEKNLA
jgi:hypothetical protein